MTWPEPVAKTLPGPLEGIRVLDLTRIIAGPLASMYLADLGADVIKVERPTGDEMRHYGPEKWNGLGSTFLALNRNKRSYSLDLNDQESREKLLKLIDSADVLLESFRPGIMERWGLTPSALHERNPKLVYCSITGFGSRGPASKLGANNLIAEAFGGSMSVSSEMLHSRLKTGTPMTDYFTGTAAALAVTAALFERERTGKGTTIETSLLESQAMMMSGYIVGYLASDNDPSPESGLPFTVPNQSFDTKDGKIVLAVNSEAMWVRMCEGLGLSDWLENPDLETNAQRMNQQDVIIDHLDGLLRTQNSEYWLEIFEKYRVTAGPINSVSNLLSHPQAAAQELLLPIENESIDNFAAVRLPFSYSHRDWSDLNHSAPPKLGENNQEIDEVLS